MARLSPSGAVAPGFNRQVLLARRPSGEPRDEDFRVVDVPQAKPAAGQVLLETLWISLDPYMRLRMDERESYAPAVQLGQPMVAGGVARVVDSQAPGLRPGDIVAGGVGWQSHPVVDAAALRRLELTADSARQALGALGMPGLTAYCGLMEIGQPRAGETVVVGAAAGAVGSLVGQIARIQGCRVVGVAGGAEKCRLAVEQYGFDACIDHRAADMGAQLAAACPRGVDVYFENIGGEVLAAVLPLLNLAARVPLCGLISSYNDSSGHSTVGKRDLLPGFLYRVLERRLTVRGFISSDFLDRRPVFEREMTRWLEQGLIRYQETITQGLEEAPGAFMRMLRGGSTGKTLVKVA
jgi:hypothetical protein